MPARARIAVSAAAFALYALLLFRARLTLWHDALIFPCVLWLAMWAIAPIDARRRVLALALIATVGLSIGLVYVWTVGWGGRNHVFGGIFALSDAGEYYWDAERVLHGATMNTGGARRPIFSAVLAGVLRVIGNDVHLAHDLTMLAWAASGAFAVAEVWRTHGHRAASIVFVLFVLFARRYVGFVQSEGIGVPLGALAFGLSWRVQSMNSEARWQPTYLGALLLQSIALLARPGPIFVIVAMVVWGVRRADKSERAKLLVQSIGVVGVALAVQQVVRMTTAGTASFSDLPPILYGLVHGEDSQFVWAHNPALGELPESARAGTIWALLRHDLVESPALIVLAPLRCLATWLYLPQGLFGMVWLNPDDRALENAAAVKQSMADHGYVGPLVLWVHELGAYSLLNAVAMALGGIAFVSALLRSAWKAWRARRSDRPPFFVAILLGVLVSLPFLPPWITEGAQILASVFFFVVTFAVTSFLPANATHEVEGARPAPVLAPAVLAALVALVGIARAFPLRPPMAACRDDGAYLADVDRHAVVPYGTEDSALRLGDARANVAMLEKNNKAFAGAIAETLGTPHRIFPAYDACRDRLLYVVEDVGPGAGRDLPDRWQWLSSTPMAQKPLERLTR
ncbi:MAG: hypothetical protein NVS3B10_15910 [Polyangiales bacterium]